MRQLGMVKAFPTRDASYDDQSRTLQEMQPRVIHVVDSYPHWPPTLWNHRRWRVFEELLKTGTAHTRVIRIAKLQHWQAVLDMLHHWRERSFYVGVLLEDPPEIPIVRCIILDGKVVFFGQLFLGDLQKGSIKITEPIAAALFDDYFRFLWGKAVIVKGERGLDKEAMDHVERWLASRDKGPSAAEVS